MDFITGNKVWDFYASFAGYFSSAFIWLLLACAIIYYLSGRKELCILSLIVFFNQLINHSVSGFLWNHPMVWNVAWIVSDLILVYAIFIKIKHFNRASFQDISVVMLSAIAAVINLLRYIERLSVHYQLEPIFSVKPFYSASANAINLVIFLVLISPIVKSVFIKLKDIIDGTFVTTYQRFRRSRDNFNS